MLRVFMLVIYIKIDSPVDQTSDYARRFSGSAWTGAFTNLSGPSAIDRKTKYDAYSRFSIVHDISILQRRRGYIRRLHNMQIP